MIISRLRLVLRIQAFRVDPLFTARTQKSIVTFYSHEATVAGSGGTSLASTSSFLSGMSGSSVGNGQRPYNSPSRNPSALGSAVLDVPLREILKIGQAKPKV